MAFVLADFEWMGIGCFLMSCDGWWMIDFFLVVVFFRS